MNPFWENVYMLNMWKAVFRKTFAFFLFVTTTSCAAIIFISDLQDAQLGWLWLTLAPRSNNNPTGAAHPTRGTTHTMQTSQITARSLVKEYVSEAKRTASIDPTPDYLVGFFQETLTMLVSEHPAVKDRIKGLVEHMILEPSRP